MIGTQENRRAGMPTGRLSRRSRTILAMDSLMMSVGNDPGRVTRQDIAAKAADWTTDEVDMFAAEGEDEYTDYYELINALMHIVHAMRHEGE